MQDITLEYIKKNIKTFSPIVKEYWWIKFSNCNGSILMFCGSILTGEVVTNYFYEEDDAVMYVNWLLHQDPSKLLNKQLLPRNSLTKKNK